MSTETKLSIAVLAMAVSLISLGTTINTMWAQYQKIQDLEQTLANPHRCISVCEKEFEKWGC